MSWWKVGKLSGRFGEYASTVIGYWQFWLAVAFMIERTATTLSTRAAAWSIPHFGPERRRKVFWTIAILAFVYANFRAFDQEHQKVIALQKPTLDPQSLYQGSVPVASFTAPLSDGVNNTISFQSVTATRELDMAQEFEFRSWRLLCSGQRGGEATFTAARFINYHNVVCRIQGLR